MRRPSPPSPPHAEADGEVVLRRPKTLYRLLERIFEAADDQHGGRRLLAWCLREFFGAFRDELGLGGIWLYSGERNRFHLVETIGECEHRPPSTLDGTRGEMRTLLEQGVVDGLDEEASRSLHRLGVTGRMPAVAMLIAEPRARHVVFTSLQQLPSRASADFVLRTLRSVLSARILQNRWAGSIREAAEIQRGLLPTRHPTFEGYDIAARSQPAEDVGGDLYDFLRIEAGTLGVAIADASGHGLGAALVARDVSVGLRMGARPETKVTHLLSQLNRVVHASGTANSFVSAFYGELGREGDLLYVNAGHPPPLLADAGTVRELGQGNIVLGPLPDARFQRRFAHLDPGAVLILYTDGIVERQDASGGMFGVERLRTTIRSTVNGSADSILDAVFSAAQRFGNDLPWDDDATVVVVKRLEASNVRASNGRATTPL